MALLSYKILRRPGQQTYTLLLSVESGALPMNLMGLKDEKAGLNLSPEKLERDFTAMNGGLLRTLKDLEPDLRSIVQARAIDVAEGKRLCYRDTVRKSRWRRGRTARAPRRHGAYT